MGTDQKSKSQDEPKKLIESLRNQITWLELKPESFVNISDIAKNYNVSRTPVKEALINMEANGWVKRQGTHFIVTPLSFERLREIAEVRSVIEIKAYSWAMERLTDQEAEVLKEYKDKIKAANSSASKKEIISLDIEIHLFLFQAAKNRYIYNLLERSLYHALRFWLSMNLSPAGILDDMNEMIEAIEQKDGVRLLKVSSRHIKNWSNGIVGGI